MKKVITAALVIAWIGFVVSPSYAAEEVKPAVSKPTAKNLTMKFGRGLVNASTGWVELFRHTYQVGKEENPLAGVTYGVVKGSLYTVARETTGAVETGLFFVPGPHGSYTEPLMKPEYAFPL